MAAALRNSLVHIRPFIDKDMFWAVQFNNFFVVNDYGIPGYVLPTVKTDNHIHLTNVLVGYDHSEIIVDSPIQIRLEIGSCDLTGRIIREMERFKFQFLLQDIKLVCNFRRFYSF